MEIAPAFVLVDPKDILGSHHHPLAKDGNCLVRKVTSEMTNEKALKFVNIILM